MASDEIVKETIHPYQKNQPRTHGHFLPTKVTYPPYSFPARPFAWLMRDNIWKIKEAYNIDFQQYRETK